MTLSTKEPLILRVGRRFTGFSEGERALGDIQSVPGLILKLKLPLVEQNVLEPPCF